MKEYSADQLTALLRAIILAKFEPDERHFFVGHEQFELFVSDLCESVLVEIGQEQYEELFYRNELSTHVKKFIAASFRYHRPRTAISCCATGSVPAWG